MADIVTLRLTGQEQLKQELEAVSAAIAIAQLRAAVLAGAAPILTAMMDHAPLEIRDEDIEAEIIASDADHVAIEVRLSGPSDVLTQQAQDTIKAAVSRRIDAAVAAITDNLTNALSRVSGT